MSWFKIDDAFHSSKPVKKIPRKYRAAAIGLWALAGSWSAQEEEDGFVPEWMIEELCGTPALAAHLVRAGLWTIVPAASSAPPTALLGPSSVSGEPGWQFKNWEKYNPTRAELDEKREKERIRKANYRMSQRDTNGTPEGQPQGHQQETAPPDPTRPDPLTTANAVVKESMSNAASGEDAGKQYEPEVHELCNYLADWIARNGNKRPTVGQAWLQACDRLIRLDDIRPDQIRTAIDWSQRDEFWRANILSMPKLREKYPQLRLSAQRTAAPAPGQPRASTTQNRLQTGQTMVEKLKAKEQQREQAQQDTLLQIGANA